MKKNIAKKMVIVLLIINLVFPAFVFSSEEKTNIDMYSKIEYANNSVNHGTVLTREQINSSTHASPFSHPLQTELGEEYGLQTIPLLTEITVAQIHWNMEDRRITTKPSFFRKYRNTDDGDPNRIVKILDGIPESGKTIPYLMGICGYKADEGNRNEDNFEFDITAKILYLCESEYHAESIYLVDKMRPLSFDNGIGITTAGQLAKALGGGLAKDNLLGSVFSAFFANKKHGYMTDKYDGIGLSIGYLNNPKVKNSYTPPQDEISVQVEEPKRMYLKPYLFAFEVDTPLDAYKENHQWVAARINRDKSYLMTNKKSVYADGHCDTRGTEGYNADLGLRRGVNVVSPVSTILINQYGWTVAETKAVFEPRSAGEYQPTYSEHDFNRRVDIYYADKMTEPPTGLTEIPKFDAKKGG